MDKFGANFLTKDGTSDGAYLKDLKLVGLYFGAKYCKPAQDFNQKLIDFYKDINKDDKIFEIIYFGFDQKQIEFQETMKDMPWLAYDFKDEKKIKIYFEFKQDIPGIPALLIINPQNGKLLTRSGRGNVEKDQPYETFEKWIEIKDIK